MVYTDKFCGTVDIITGIDDFVTPNISYNPEFHTYRLDGNILPSVTQLLDDGGYKYVDPEILKAAQDRGTIIHKEIEVWLNTKKVGFTEELFNFIDLFEENKELFEQEAIWDIKTYSVASSKNKDKCYNQLKMYQEAIKYLTRKDITQKYMIHLPKGKKAKIIDLTKEYEYE